MRGPKSPRFGPASLRLALGVSGAIILLSLAAMVAQYRLTERSLMARQEALLASDVQAFDALYQQRRIPALRQAMESRAETSDPKEELFLLLDKQGTKLAGNLEAWPNALPLPVSVAETPSPSPSPSPSPASEPPVPAEAAPAANGDGKPQNGSEALAPWRNSARPSRIETQSFNVLLDGELIPYQGVTELLPGGFALLVARGTGAVSGTLSDLRQMILIVGAGLALTALLLGWLVSARVIGRIARVNDLADRVAAGDLAARLPGPRSRDEYGALESHVHLMLDRIENLNRATHRLSESIAHELRTPLNRMVQKLAALEGEDAAIAAIRAEMRQAIRVFDSLLDISSAEAQSGSTSGVLPVNLSDVAEEVFELYEPVGEDRGLRMSFRQTPGLWVLGDRNLIAQLVSNLIDNAIKFTPSGGDVTVLIHTDAARHCLIVQDSGPGLPPEMRGAVLERFVRAKDSDHVKGHGLGLALVQAIATRHGAKLELLDAAPGLKVQITWPVLAAPPAAT